MTLGEKISKERKALNYTQEQLAEILGVSRQTISKWESDIAYPETEKLIKLGKIFECSMDYLLNEDMDNRDGYPREADNQTHNGGKDKLDMDSAIDKISTYIRSQCRERKSEKMVCGMPLYHIGKDARGFFAIGLKARGVFAIGLRARGVVSLGLLSIGVLSIGLLSIGLAALGTLALGLLAVGSIALGLFAAGAISIGIVSFGALSIGCFSSGAMAIGHYIAIGDHANAMIAIGDTKAAGTVYEAVGGMAKVPVAYVRDWLDGNVPWYFGWAKEIFKLYLGH